jgi:hypothetical protein
MDLRGVCSGSFHSGPSPSRDPTSVTRSRVMRSPRVHDGSAMESLGYHPRRPRHAA